MDDRPFNAIPPTSQLMQELRLPVRKTWPDKTISGLVIVMAILLIGVVVAYALDGAMPREVVKGAALIAAFAIWLCMAATLVVLIVDAWQDIRNNLRNAGEDMDRRRDRENHLIDRVSACCPELLAEHARRVKREADVLRTRMGLTTAIGAVTTLASSWATSLFTSLPVKGFPLSALTTSAGIGATLGGVLLIIRIQHLDRLSDVLSMAVARIAGASGAAGSKPSK